MFGLQGRNLYGIGKYARGRFLLNRNDVGKSNDKLDDQQSVEPDLVQPTFVTQPKMFELKQM